MIAAPDIPGHTVTGVLGSGGFATVYRAWQVAVGRETAVKVDSRVLHTERDRRRFVREVTAAGRLSGHPHVIDVYDAGTLPDGRPYLVMEFCPGGSLEDELRRGGPMSAQQACRIGVGLADALAAAHAAGILHRDIKPANVLINQYGLVGLSDFGLASVMAAGGEQSVSRDALTPAYAPPESFRAAEPTQAADLYSLAATVYALMAGRPPRFPADGRSPGVATILALHGQPVDDIPGVPARMLDIVRQCLAADPAQRLPSAAALRDDLAALLGEPGRAHARTPPRAMPSLATSPVASAQHAETTGRHRAGTSSPTPGTAGTGHPGERRGPRATAGVRRGPRVPLAVVGGLALAAIAVLIAGSWLLAPTGGPASSSSGPSHGPASSRAADTVGTFGIATTTRRCPAASVAGAGARCPRSPECWDGLVESEGEITARLLPCARRHTWQTFAIAIIPTAASAFNVNIVQANPAVRAVCSYKVLLASRIGRARLIPASRWSIQVLPPDEAAYDSGIRTYRCLATLGYARSRTSQFGR